jgi:hypothetical protein
VRRKEVRRKEGHIPHFVEAQHREFSEIIRDVPLIRLNKIIDHRKEST